MYTYCWKSFRVNNSTLSQDESVAAVLENQNPILLLHQHYIKNVLNLEMEARAVLCNGRIIGPLDSGEEFTSEDFSLLERFSQSTYGDKLFMKLIKDQIFNEDEYGTMIWYMYTICITCNIFSITAIEIIKYL